MTRKEVDERARDVAVAKYALPLCLHVPIAARDEDAIRRCIGRIECLLTPRSPHQALLIHPYDAPELNLGLPIWGIKEAAVLHCQRQVWVHVNYARYRSAYVKAFPDGDLTGLVLDHILNRRVARLKGFDYLRIVPITRAANSSSGGMSEKWAVAYHDTPRMVENNKEQPTFIQYADLADIVKMLNIKTGGSLQEGVNEGQRLVRER